MGKYIIGSGVLLIGVGGLLFNFAPDVLALVILGIMCLIVLLGYLVGILPVLLYAGGFRTARKNLERANEVNSTSPWLAVQQLEYLFHQSTLDRLFTDYKNKVNRQFREELIASDIEEVINEDALALRSWQNVIQQIPGTLTALGLLGTFIGLVTGIGGIGFSSVDAAISSIELLLAGINVAFYTSIAGVIYSILFNLLYKLIWNMMVREYGLFTEMFHMQVLPTVEEQSRERQRDEMKLVLERLDRLPKRKDSTFMGNGSRIIDYGNEQRVMQEIREGMNKGEFTFYVQPRYDLNSRSMVGGEALMRWDHETLGIIAPTIYIPVVEANGYIVKLDRFIWEEVCKTIRRWIDSGIRPVPISVNISKTDILAMDVPGFFKEMIYKYKLPPRYLEFEISEIAYLQSYEAVIEVEKVLREHGFRVVVDGFDGDFMALGSMKDTEADAIKLDLRFIGENGLNVDVINDIFLQSRKLHVPLTVSGIESTEHLDMVKKAGCAEGQGFYLQRPIAIEKFENLMSRE